MKDTSILRNVELREASLLKSVYMWLFAGLLLTAGVSFGVSQSPALLNFFLGNPFSLLILAGAQIFVAISLSARTENMREGKAVGFFLLYAALTGITFGSIFVVFSASAITKAFLSASAVFLGASLYGTFSKKNVRSMGRYLFMGLWGILIATLLNMFFYSSTMDLMISIAGVVLFTGLTIWDTNKICDINRRFGSEMSSSELTKLGVVGALDLYLDFINIFLYLLRIFGRSDD